MEPNIKWMDEIIVKVPKQKFFYWFMKLFLFKRKGLTYKEMYMIFDAINRNRVGDEKSKKFAMTSVLELYKYNNNNNLPEGLEEND